MVEVQIKVVTRLSLLLIRLRCPYRPHHSAVAAVKKKSIVILYVVLAFLGIPAPRHSRDSGNDEVYFLRRDRPPCLSIAAHYKEATPSL